METFPEARRLRDPLSFDSKANLQMNCPVCPNAPLKRSYLEAGLVTDHCEKCDGHWLPRSNYQCWLEGSEPRTCANGASLLQPANMIDSDASADESLPPVDSISAKLCPHCRHLLLRYRVDFDLDFRIDRCGRCAGVWLDRAEWRAIREAGLHRELHLVFTRTWQNRLHEDELRRQREQRLENRLGKREWRRLKALRTWIDRHPRENELRAYLTWD